MMNRWLGAVGSRCAGGEGWMRLNRRTSKKLEVIRLSEDPV